MMDQYLTERRHRDLDHQGLPEANSKRAGYMSPADKVLLDSLRLLDIAARLGATTDMSAYATAEDLRQHARTYHGTATQYQAVTWLLPHMAVLPAAGAPTYSAVVTGANVSYQSLTFADATTNTCYFQVAVPTAYNGGTIWMYRYWLLGTTTSANYRLYCVGTLLNTSEALDAAGVSLGVGGTRAYGGAGYAAGELFRDDEGWGTNRPSPNELCILRFARLGAHAEDTVNQAMTLLGIKLEFPCTLR